MAEDWLDLDLDASIPLPQFASIPAWLSGDPSDGVPTDDGVDVEEYMAAFDAELVKQQVVLRTLPAEEALLQEAAMERARLRHLTTKAEVFAAHELEAVNAEREARVAVRDKTRGATEALRHGDARLLESMGEGCALLRQKFKRHEVVLKDRLRFLHNAEINDLGAPLGDVPRKHHVDHALHAEQWKSAWAPPPRSEGVARNVSAMMSPMMSPNSAVAAAEGSDARDDTASSAARYHAARRSALDSGTTVGGVGALDRRWRASSRSRPTPVEIRINALRAVKDKVPAGEYCVVVSLLNQLGGSPLHWSSGRGPIGGGSHPATTPVPHAGRFYDINLFIQQSIYMAAPAPEELRPSHVWIIELFLLSNRDDDGGDGGDDEASQAGGEGRNERGENVGKTVSDEEVMATGALRPLDLAVGWTCLPVCGPDLSVADGNFRLPMLRGGVDSSIDSYASFERRIAENIDSWLCNIYFAIQPLVKELLVEHDRPDSEFDLTHPPTVALVPKDDVDGAAARDRLDEARAGGGDPRRPHATSAVPPFWLFGGVRGAHREAMARTLPCLACCLGVAQEEERRSVEGEVDGLEPLPWTRSEGVNPRQLRLWSAEMRSALAAKAVEVDETTAAREKLQHQHDFLTNGIAQFNMSMASRVQVAAAVKESEMWDHSRPFCTDKQTKRLEFVKQITWFDLGLRNPYTVDFWVCIIALLISLWLRVYVHYAAQYLFLKAFSVPVYSYTAQWSTVLLKYESQSISAEGEMMLVFAGPFACVLLLAALMGIALLWHRFISHVPRDFSRFTAMWIVATFIDPLLIFVTDVVNLNFNCFQRAPCDTAFSSAQCLCAEGDAFKLVRTLMNHDFERLPFKTRLPFPYRFSFLLLTMS